MPDRNQPALDFLLSRRSRPAKTLTGPAPDRDALTEILTAAARTPDHGKLEPWRFIVLERGALDRLADLAKARGEAIGAIAMTEPAAGSDVQGIKTTAIRDGDEYVINGQKLWTSRAEHSDLMLLLARTTPRGQVTKRTEGLSVFLVDMKAALGNGLTIRPIDTMMNHSTTEVFFANMRVPSSHLIVNEGQGFQ